MIKELIVRILLFIRPILNRLPDTDKSRKLKRRLHLAGLIRKGTFLSEIEYNVETARDRGVKIGRNCRIVGGVTFNSEPYLVELGDNVLVAGEVKFITHDGGIQIFSDTQKDLLGNFGRIKIGNNCFIGMRAMILPNVEIGDNCIVAAGAVVMDSFPDDCVIMGNPAKVIYKTSLYKTFKLNGMGTVRDSEYGFPHEEYMPEDRKRELILKHTENIPFKRIKTRK